MTAKELVELQSDLDYLWILEPSYNERLLMAALRHLHATIEGDKMEAERAKKIYLYIDPSRH